MASFPFSGTLFIFSLWVILLSSPAANSLTCTSQTFTNRTLYSNCSDLRTLNAFLHWTYNATNSSLSIAFIAPPADSDGWVSWAINPTSTGMIGSQALVAFELNDAMTVKTYNITSYGPITESKLSFDVWDLSSEYSNGEMRIFASLKVPAMKQTLNQVWQVGSDVGDDGVPKKHAFELANLNAKATLELVAGAAATPAHSPVPSIPGAGAGENGASVIGRKNVGFFFLLSSLLLLL